VNFSDLFIRKPVMTVLAMASILLFGLVGYRLLPVSDLPNVDFPTIVVGADLVGASPMTMASSVATVLEKECSAIPGLDSMSSRSVLGATRITLQFSLERNIDAAAQDVQAAIARAQRYLPANLKTPPFYRRSNPANQPVLTLALHSPTISLAQLDQYGQTMSQRISMVNGVAEVLLRGTQKYAVRIQLDPLAMNACGLAMEDVAKAVGEQNVNQPMGSLTGPHRAMTLMANGQLSEASQYGAVILAVRNGRPVRLADVAKVIDSVENTQDTAWFYTSRASAQSISLSVMKQPGQNTVELAEAVKGLLPTFQAKLPAAVHLEVLTDASLPIKASVGDVKDTLLLTLVLVVLVIFLFIRNLSATVIPSLAVPMSLIGTFAAMYLLGYSLDNMSLMALTLSVGFVVDDAIVMLENITRHMEMGKGRMEAALAGAREVGFTILSMTLSLAAVFIPLLFLGGIMGRLFREFSVTIGVAVLVSGFISLTLTPMLASRFLREQRRPGPGASAHHGGAGLQWLLRGYGQSLRTALRHKRTVLAGALAILAATVFLFIKIPKGFIPSEDRGMITINTQTAQDLSYPSRLAHHAQLARIIQEDPNVDRFMMAVSDDGQLRLMLKPRAERRLSVDQVIAELRPKLNRVPGIRAMPINPPPINVGGRYSRSQYQLSLQGADIDQIYRTADKLVRAMGQLPELQDVSSDMELENPQLNVEIDRDQATMLGVSPRTLEDTLYSAYGSRTISTIFAPNDQYSVIIELDPQFQTRPAMLGLLSVRSDNGKLVPLQAVTRQRENVGPLSVNHVGQLPAVTISFNLKADVVLGPALAGITRLTRTLLPDGVVASFQGSAQQFQSSQGSMGWLIGLTVIVIYIILGMLYESFLHPLTILTALPLAGFGALLTLMLFHTELSMYAFVGIIMLVGIVKKNGIMMIDFALEAQRQEGKNATDAIYEACIIRFRPIMMTTMAALMAGLPIAMGYGAGAESRRPLGLAVVGGLLFSQTLTLYVTPVFFIYMDALHQWLTQSAPHSGGSPAVPEDAIPQ